MPIKSIKSITSIKPLKSLAALILVAVLAAASHTAIAGQNKVAVCHFTGQPTVIQGAFVGGSFDPLATVVISQGHVIEVAEPAAANLAEHGDVIVPVGIADVEKGALCQHNEVFDALGNSVECNVFIVGANGGAPFPCP